MPTGKGDPAKSEQVLVRVSTETYASLQLAQPFVKRRSMQDLVSTIVEKFLEELREREPGYRKALLGLREAEAREQGVLARRSPGASARSRGSRSSGPAGAS